MLATKRLVSKPTTVLPAVSPKTTAVALPGTPDGVQLVAKPQLVLVAPFHVDCALDRGTDSTSRVKKNGSMERGVNVFMGMNNYSQSSGARSRGKEGRLDKTQKPLD
jgi:hypothetical protein